MAEPRETEVAETPEEEPKKSRGIVPLAAVLVVALAGGGVLGAKSLGPKVGAELAARAESSAKASQEAHEGEGAAIPVHVVDNLVVNPAGSDGARFLLTSVAIETRNPADTAVLTRRDVEIRDAFIMVLGAKTVSQLADISQRPALSDELKGAVQKLVGPGVVSRIYLPQFVIQ